MNSKPRLLSKQRSRVSSDFFFLPCQNNRKGNKQFLPLAVIEQSGNEMSLAHCSLSGENEAFHAARTKNPIRTVQKWRPVQDNPKANKFLNIMTGGKLIRFIHTYCRSYGWSKVYQVNRIGSRLLYKLNSEIFTEEWMVQNRLHITQ